jgi:hypothetical protein
MKLLEISWVYPVVPLFSGLYNCRYRYLFCTKRFAKYIDSIPTFVEKIKISGLYFVLFGLSLAAIPFLATKENSQNIFSNELQSNGYINFICFYE